MDVLKIIKYAFVVAALMYAVVAVTVAGPPDWNRPLLPERQDGPILCGVFLRSRSRTGSRATPWDAAMRPRPC